MTNLEKLAYNKGLFDAAEIMSKRMWEIVNRPMGEAPPNPVDVMARLISEIVATKK